MTCCSSCKRTNFPPITSVDVQNLYQLTVVYDGRIYH